MQMAMLRTNNTVAAQKKSDIRLLSVISVKGLPGGGPVQPV